MDIDVRLRMFTWFADVSGAVAVSRMGPEEISRARARRMSHNVVTSRVFGPMPRGVFVTDRVADTDIGPVPVRLYRPHTARALPVVVNFHGGGGTLGNLDQSDWLCAHVASRVGALVVSVDYRLAPEFRYPAGREDGYAAVSWVARHAAALGARTDRLAVMGDSAGGNLAAVVCLLAREAGPVIDAQVLLYPALDLTFTRPSVERFADGPVLTRADMEVFRTHYLGEDGDPTDPLCSPLFAPDVADLPPALVVTAAVDPLHDDGADYVARLGAAGVPAKHTDHARAVHGFLSFPGVCRASAAALDDVCAELTVRLA
ncbi:alpha/beta hydrolase [Actinomycetospora callitridis]|uniref:alpha/beta hydrolase n=1 Tax=Actinomycetospora callitridis TaxID=913944 RepID=UPI002365D885|nr:alpha/beta hydrolase [Actinomycetospora callitridis]MDD7916155.1 alpha/beta hydrolase [Actinomycetospora callitridis]